MHSPIVLKSIRVHLAAGSKVVKIFTHLRVIIFYFFSAVDFFLYIRASYTILSLQQKKQEEESERKKTNKKNNKKTTTTITKTKPQQRKRNTKETQKSDNTVNRRRPGPKTTQPEGCIPTPEGDGAALEEVSGCS